MPLESHPESHLFLRSFFLALFSDLLIMPNNCQKSYCWASRKCTRRLKSPYCSSSRVPLLLFSHEEEDQPLPPAPQAPKEMNARGLEGPGWLGLRLRHARRPFLILPGAWLQFPLVPPILFINSMWIRAEATRQWANHGPPFRPVRTAVSQRPRYTPDPAVTGFPILRVLRLKSGQDLWLRTERD